jgi:hypothetical protein
MAYERGDSVQSRESRLDQSQPDTAFEPQSTIHLVGHILDTLHPVMAELSDDDGRETQLAALIFTTYERVLNPDEAQTASMESRLPLFDPDWLPTLFNLTTGWWKSCKEFSRNNDRSGSISVGAAVAAMTHTLRDFEETYLQFTSDVINRDVTRDIIGRYLNITRPVDLDAIPS